MVTGMWKFFRGLDEEKAGKDRGGRGRDAR